MTTSPVWRRLQPAVPAFVPASGRRDESRRGTHECVRHRRSQGFTLLEMLVATMIMGIAVVGLLSNLSTSLRNASRLTEYDRAALLAKRKMDELLLDTRLPKDRVIEAQFDPAVTGVEGGWRARLSTFEEPPNVAPGVSVLERLELQVWWMSGARRRVLSMEAFRTATILPPNPAGGGGAP